MHLSVLLLLIVPLLATTYYCDGHQTTTDASGQFLMDGQMHGPSEDCEVHIKLETCLPDQMLQFNIENMFTEAYFDRILLSCPGKPVAVFSGHSHNMPPIRCDGCEGNILFLSGHTGYIPSVDVSWEVTRVVSSL